MNGPLPESFCTPLPRRELSECDHRSPWWSWSWHCAAAQSSALSASWCWKNLHNCVKTMVNWQILTIHICQYFWNKKVPFSKADKCNTVSQKHNWKGCRYSSIRVRSSGSIIFFNRRVMMSNGQLCCTRTSLGISKWRKSMINTDFPWWSVQGKWDLFPNPSFPFVEFFGSSSYPVNSFGRVLSPDNRVRCIW